MGFLIAWKVEGGAGRGVVTVLLRGRGKKRGGERQKRELWMTDGETDGGLGGWMDGWMTV